MFRDLVDQVAADAGKFAIGELQTLRSQRRGRGPSKRPVLGKPSDKGWVYHWGGRKELQFNLGLDSMPDGSPAFRAGVAFSLEPGRDLTDVSVLYPKIDLFNQWIAHHSDDFSDMALWACDTKFNRRSTDFPVGPIHPSLKRPDRFVFIGARQPLASADPHLALVALDRLLPAWEWIEASHRSDNTGSQSGGVPSDDVLVELGAGRELPDAAWIDVRFTGRETRVFLRHREIQRQLISQLRVDGFEDVRAEGRLGRMWVDVTGRKDGALWFFEVKAGLTVRSALREAVGQLLEYALWDRNERPAQLVVVGEDAPTPLSKAYLAKLNASFPIPIRYRQVVFPQEAGHR